MIFYFSATGSTAHVAETIRLEDEQVVSVEEAVKAGNYAYTLCDDRLGILTPTYDWGLPDIVYEFLKELSVSFDKKPYTFYVGTFGTTTGAASSITASLLKAKGLRPDAMFDIRMPDTWTVLFDLSDEEKVAETIRRAEQEIAELKAQLTAGVKGRHMDLTAPGFTGRIGKFIYDRKVRKTSHLSVSDACIGCGLCAKKCPVSAIEMRDGKPAWVKEACTMCLGCLHRCPRYAIRYDSGRATDAHGQYTYAKYRK